MRMASLSSLQRLSSFRDTFCCLHFKMTEDGGNSVIANNYYLTVYT